MIPLFSPFFSRDTQIAVQARTLQWKAGKAFIPTRNARASPQAVWSPGAMDAFQIHKQ